MSQDQSPSPEDQSAPQLPPAPPVPPVPPAQPVGWEGLEPDTSERLYGTEELAAYTQRLESTPVPPAADPLNGPMSTPVPPPPPQPAESPAPAQQPLAPQSAQPAPTAWNQRPQHAAPAQQSWAQQPPAPPAPAAQPSQPPAQPTAPTAAPGPPTQAEPQRFMRAADFLDRRADQVEYGPATWGWRGKVRKWSGGAITPKMGAAELAHEQHRRAIQRDFEGPRTIAFLNPKGGAAKTTSVLMSGFTFGTIRGGGVVAWDNNETRGTLGIRGTRSSHRNTTRELLEDLERFNDVYQARIGDLGAFVRSQGDAHFDVLASDERPDVTGTIRATDFTSVHQLLERFYRVILVDTGNNMRAENWLAAAEIADLLVVTSTIREDTGYSGLWMLDALQDAGYQNLKHKTVTVLSDPSSHVDEQLAHDLTQVYEQRTKAVYRVPYDPVLVAGSVVPYAMLSTGTQAAWLKACAGMAHLL
jgi:MinD-like ATPase involved in chromosome partitioning or flagellar assembly